MWHFFEFVSGFAVAMMAELCWCGASVNLATPSHIVRFLPGSRAGGALVHLVALVWLTLAIVGVVLFAVRLATGAWWQALVISAGAIMWVVYRMTYYRVSDVMHAEARSRREQD